VKHGREQKGDFWAFWTGREARIKPVLLWKTLINSRRKDSLSGEPAFL
jgi:hypothetical protein